MSLRLFLGLLPTAAEAEATAGVQHAVAWPAGARLVPRENLHVTLHFLGDVDESGLDALARAADTGSPPFEIVLDRFAVWHGGVAVLEPAAVPEALCALHARLGAGLRAAGFALEDRAYRPHVTLARHAQGAQPPADLPPRRWIATHHVLVQSADGRYLPLRRFPSPAA